MHIWQQFVDSANYFSYNKIRKKPQSALRGFFIMEDNYVDSFDKRFWFVLQTYSGYENKVKETLLQRAQTYIMLE